MSNCYRLLRTNSILRVTLWYGVFLYVGPPAIRSKLGYLLKKCEFGFFTLGSVSQDGHWLVPEVTRIRITVLLKY